MNVLFQVSSTEEREKKILEEYKELELKAEQEKKNLDQKYTKVWLAKRIRVFVHSMRVICLPIYNQH